MSASTELIIKLKTPGVEKLPQLGRAFRNFGQDVKKSGLSLSKLRAELKQNQRQNTESINNVRTLSRTWREGETEQELVNIFENFYETEGIGEEEMPKDLDYIRDLWNVTIEEIEDPNYSYELGDISDWQYDSSKVSLYR